MSNDTLSDQVVAKLPLLEELELFRGNFSAEVLEAVGQCCPRLETLKFNGLGYCFSLDMSPDMEEEFRGVHWPLLENFPKLRRLELIGNSLSDIGLRAILDGCPHLESLNLGCCFNLRMKGNLRERCRDMIKSLRYTFDGAFIYDEEFYYELAYVKVWNRTLRGYSRLYS
ncbi:hypothetical protein L484_025762 [Morus notabilis]|uniref:F-box/LRR-repeat protein 15/At3g58940/PEG3-like LRR domain-containing protein n=1 Tax=Morus notabilis TaxID=981085 RepID=W9REF3_9ROSA|nr:putative F-box/LRR-repeat protein 23 [Morus notabilis]EXB67281.1 hypothetical protein L484_025762 [Morus notabilis]